MGKRLAVGVLVTATVAVSAVSAFAAWTVSGTGQGAARAQSMPAGHTPSGSVSGRNVTVSWTQSSFTTGPAVAGYVVKRYANGGGIQTIQAACAGVVSSLSCTEHGVPVGSWQYTVTTAQGNWRGAESSRSSAVSVGGPSLTLAPSNPTVTLPSTLTGTIANFVDGETIAFHLDGAGGTTLSGTVAGTATPAPVPAGGGASITVSLPGSGISDGAHSVFAVASPSGESASASFTVDSTGPAVAITFPSSGSSSNAAGWAAGCGTPGTGDFCGTAADTGSGLASVKVSIRQGSGNYWNGTSFSSSTEVLLTATGTSAWSSGFAASNFPADGSYTIRALATDNVGNTGTTSVTFTYDTTPPPAPIIDSGPANPTTVTTATFTFHDTEAGATFQCQLDGGGFSACSSPKGYSGLADGSHTFQVRALDAAGNAGASTSSSWVVDTTNPTAAVTFPVAGSSYNNATWTAGCGTLSSDDFCGTAADAGSGVASVQVSIRQGSGNYWNGSAFSSASEVLLTATGTTSWSFGFAASNFATAGSYTIRAVATDGVGLTGSASSTFTIDRTAPSMSTLQMFDVNANGKVDRVVATFDESLAACTSPCTTGWTLANVPSSGALSSVTISGAQATLNITEGAGPANTAVGSFTVALSTASGITDAAGNHSSFAATAPADKAAPIPISMANANGNGTPAANDTISVVFSEKLSVSSMCSAWSNDNNDQTVSGNNQVTVTITDGGAGNDTLTVNSTTCTFHYGSIDLGSGGFVSTTRTFSGSGGNKSQIDWTVASLTLKVTLGSASGAVGTVSGSVTATYTPDSVIKDPAANSATGTASRTGVQF